ncbi:MAG: hypothetical protein QG581_404 [Patescibacteria group bacterium]|jgi:hypothetical protein|nr:hypothetical protein [Patescibacteria group bacterium]
MNTRTRIEFEKKPVARIINDDGQPIGEVKGTPAEIEQVGILTHSCEALLGCRFETTYVDDSTLHIKAIPQKCHCIKAPEGSPPIDPREALLKQILTDKRIAFPGSAVRYQQ